ncbi:hypothetical protein ACFV1L_06085 [Kitasatospora sp. NPDC059646]|uniref:hypothetical protein n=1 Tax=Kitasatospora sp. NPDC059646 TaxID=3346893 RepID=UPI0036753FD4
MPTAKKTTADAAVEAAQAEATESPTVFEYLGIEFTVPPFLDIPMDLLEATDELEAVRIVIGESKWAEFRAARPTIRDFRNLSELINRAQAGSGN